MSQAQMSMRVVGAGMCCAIGRTARAASCALRAGMDHFQESQFVTEAGLAIPVARLPDTDTWGADRLGRWLRNAVADCLAPIGDFDASTTPIYFLTPDESRPHSEQHERLTSVGAAHQTLGFELHAQSMLFAAGRAGVGAAVMQARTLLQQRQTPRVLLVGADSLLNAATVNHYLSADRLLVPGNANGFIPGEAAAAVLLQASTPDAPGLHITGVGGGLAEGRPDGSVPSRARALSRAMREALTEARMGTNALHFRLSDQNGESFFAREAANALTRVTTPGGPTPRTLTTADCTGEVGAATGPLMLAWLHHLLPRADGPGPRGLIHLANDEGLRCALTVDWRA